MKRLWIASACLVAFAAWCYTPSTAAQEAQPDRGEQAFGDSHGTRQSHSSQQQSDQSLRASSFIADFDDNGDGQLTRQELPPRMRDQFDRLDANGNGQLTKSELTQHGKRQEARSAAMPIELVYIWVNDAHQDRLSMREIQRAYDTLQKVDKDGDGELTRQELQACQRSNNAKWARMVVDRLDNNGDDEISRNEAQGTFLARRFENVDQDGDGAVTGSELKQGLNMAQRGSPAPPSETRTSESSESSDDQEFDDRD